MVVSKRIVLHFPKRLADQPIVYKLVKNYNLEFNILKASVFPEEGGLLVLGISGEQQDYDNGIKYLAASGVKIQSLSQNITRNEDRCTHCGACVTVCPAGAFEVNQASREVEFHDERCVACGLCIKACPPRAMEQHF